MPNFELSDVIVFEASDSEQDASADLARMLSKFEISAPFVVASTHGRGLASGITSRAGAISPVRGADQNWAAELGMRARHVGADAIVAIGGGRCIDVAKLASARAGLIVVTVPTQLSHDGICSPVAVVPGEDGRTESIGAVTPRAVFLSLPTLLGAPLESLRAGIGDLLANPLALRDWALAAERGLEEIEPRAWQMSIESFRAIEPYLGVDLRAGSADKKLLISLAEALVLSGMAMISAGSSRPASGAEHEISHAMDLLYGGRGMHGAQVAFGATFSVALYGDDTTAFRQRLRRLGLPQHPADLHLTQDEVVEVLLEAPLTRPGRFTILENADLDESRARALVRRIWPD